MNKVILIGNLGQPPQARRTSHDRPVCNLSVATNKRYTDKGGERHEQTEWHRVVAFGPLAETCDRYLDKGSKVCVEGELRTRSWEDDAGVTRYTTEIVARVVEFLDPKERSSQGMDGSPDAFGDEEHIPF